MNIIIHPSRIPDIKKWAERKYPRIDQIVNIGYQFPPSEAKIRLEAYYVWERSGKTKSAEECWFEAKATVCREENDKAFVEIAPDSFPAEKAGDG